MDPQTSLPVVNRKFPECQSDFYDLDALLSPSERRVKQDVRSFMEEKVAPIILPYYERAEFPFPLVELMQKHQLKYAGGSMKGYGCGGNSFMESALVVCEMARVDLSAATFWLVHSGLAMESLEVCASAEQKERFLPAMARYEKLGCFGLTEPDYGSDASSLITTARRVDGGFVLNGEKRWIGNATMADIFVIWARNSDTNQVQGFIVESGSKGLSAEKMENKIALRVVQNGHITMKDVFVPDRNVMPIGTNFATGVGKVLQKSRLFVAWLPVGVCMGAYDAALSYVKTRKQFGAPLAAYQLMQEKLVRMLGTIQAMYMMAERVTRLLEAGTVTMPQITLAKAWNSLRGREVVALAREVVGGNGIITDFGVAKPFCDMEAIYTYEGSYEINALITGRAITGVSAFKARTRKSKL